MVFLALSSVACFSEPVKNLLCNAGFEAGKTGWMIDAKPTGASFDVRTSGQAIDGNYDAVIHVDDRCSFAAFSSEWISLRSSTDYTFRVYLRSDTENTEAKLSVWSWAEANGKWNKKTEAVKTVTLSENWTPYELIANLEPARAGKYQARILLNSPCTVYVDGASLTKGRTPSQKTISNPLFETGLECPQSDLLFDISQTPSAVAYVYNQSSSLLDATLDAVLTDLKDKPVWKISKPVQVTAGSTLKEQLSIPVQKRGYYRLKTTVTHSGQSRSRELAFAVIDRQLPAPPPNGYFGVDMGSHNLDRQLSRARAMGVSHIRVHESLNWKNIEKEPGQYFWPKSASYDTYQNDGFQVLVYFDGIWQGRPNWTQEMSDEETLNRYTDFCAQAAKHYSGIIHDFEMINEPWSHISHQKYSEIVQLAYPKIKTANSGATVAAVTGYSGPQVDFLQHIIQSEAINFMDVFTLHPYPRPACPEPSLVDMLQQAHGWLDEAGWDKPVWITEMGWTTPGSQLLPTRIPRPAARNNTELERAMYLARSCILSVANGVDRVYWFYFSSDNNAYYSYDMFECDSSDSVMKTVPVYAAMTSRLNNYRFEKKLSEGCGDIYAYLFSNGSRQQIVAWNSGNTDSGMFLRHSQKVTAVYDMVGNRIDPPHQADQLSFVPLSGTPVYIELEGSVSAPEVVTPISLHVSQVGNEIQGHLSITNIFPTPCRLNAHLALPDAANLTHDATINIELQPKAERQFPFSFTIDSQKKSMSNQFSIQSDIAAGANHYTLNTAEHFLYTQPLPPINAELTFNAADCETSSFAPSPLWEPNLLRCYSGKQLLLNRRPFEPRTEQVLKYKFNVKNPGPYRLRIVCSPFETDDDLRWSVNDGPFQSNASASQIGESWIYSTHPAMWWNFKCAWNDLGEVFLHEGENRLDLRFHTPRGSDYGYMALDVISFVNSEKSK